MIEVLATMPAGEDQNRLREIALMEKWNLVVCAGPAEMRRALRTGPRYSVVLIDAVIDEAEWRDVLKEVQRLAPWAAIVVAGAALWKEVVEQGGYDVLPKPFVAAQVARAVLHASWFAASRAVTR